MPPSSSRLAAVAPSPRSNARPARAELPEPRLDVHSIAGIGERLRDHHRALLSEPVPERFAALLAQLDRENRR